VESSLPGLASRYRRFGVSLPVNDIRPPNHWCSSGHFWTPRPKRPLHWGGGVFSAIYSASLPRRKAERELVAGKLENAVLGIEGRTHAHVESNWSLRKRSPKRELQRTTRNRYDKIHPTHDCGPWLYRFDLRREPEPKSPRSSSPDASQEEHRTKSEPFSFPDVQSLTRSESFSFRDAQSLPNRAASRVMGDRPKKGNSTVAGALFFSTTLFRAAELAEQIESSPLHRYPPPNANARSFIPTCRFWLSNSDALDR